MKLGRRFGFPFRVGTTSYIRPADILTNVQYLAPLVDDIELLCFESDQISPYISIDDVHELRSIALDNNLSYTIHLPVDLDFREKRESERIHDIDKVKRCIDHFLPLNPFAFNLHLNEIRNNEDLGFTLCALGELSRFTDPQYLCVENTDFDLTPCLSQLDSMGLSRCCDIGHFKLRGKEYFEQLKRARVVHLHGVEGEKDHRSLYYLERDELKSIIQLLKNRNQELVMTLEVFSENKFRESLQLLEEIYGE